MSLFWENTEFLARFWQGMGKEILYAAIVFLWVRLILQSKRIVSPSLRYGLWCLVLLRLLLPPDFSSPVSLSALWSNWHPEAVVNVAESQAINHPLTDGVILSRGPLFEAQSLDWVWWSLTLLWLIGFCVSLMRFILMRRSFRSFLAVSVPIEAPAVLERARHWCQLLGIKKPVRFLEGRSEMSPFTMGWRRPVIYLPSRLLAQGTAVFEPVIAHELAHIKRGDDLWLRFFALVRAVYFFNPMVWWTLRHCHDERERLCDRMVIQSGSMAASTYGQGLLTILGMGLPRIHKLPALSPTAKKVAFRLTSLTKYSKNKSDAHWVYCLLLFLSIAILPMATAQKRKPSGSQKEIQWQHPLKQVKVISAFGPRHNPFTGSVAHHKGVDFKASLGTWVFAPANAVVLEASSESENGSNYGTVILLDHGDGITSLFSHLNSIAVRTGQSISKGAPLGTAGETGQTTGPHLHFEIRQDGIPLDPMVFLESSQ